MANTKSAAKKAKQSLVKNQRNKSYVSMVKTAVKKFRASLEEAKSGKISKEEVSRLFVSAQSLLGKAATKGLIHKNNASRKISRMSARIKTLAGQ